MINRKAIQLLLVIITMLIFPFCASKKQVRVASNRVSPNSSLAVIIDCPNNAKNAVLAGFMKRKFKVKAINASDLYTMRDVYDIRDYKMASLNSTLKVDQSLLSMEKTYDNLYKLHIYNFEVNKAETLNEMKSKWNVDYLIILDLKDWENVSWGRAIDLSTLDLIWVENYPTNYGDNVESIIEYFIGSMSGK